MLKFRKSVDVASVLPARVGLLAEELAAYDPVEVRDQVAHLDDEASRAVLDARALAMATDEGGDDDG